MVNFYSAGGAAAVFHLLAHSDIFHHFNLFHQRNHTHFDVRFRNSGHDWFYLVLFYCPGERILPLGTF
ncbi:hypothetical protein Agabi119p4_9251 [Agaricus bisporus var. burnettii]|uniref:Uncharacterized protein n=1 Tax=Agaricus bisporus var. burnettii TaxID=192524 RepID=A0A8H7C5N4_AGABI|nr:hypothetical protein Agabi119p4_9251 [Agaricus bisporus var. burnettii]